MDPSEQSNTITQMTNFIVQEAQEKASDIREKAKQEINIENEKTITASREKIRNEFKNKKDQYEIQKRIEKSAKQNKLRIKKMAERNKYVEESIELAKEEILKRFQGDKVSYKKFLEESIIQVYP